MKLRWLLGILVFTLSACGNGVHVETAYDHKAPFEEYNTFSMMLPNQAVPVPGGIDPFKMLRMRQLTYGRLIARGFHAADPSKADFLVSVNAGAQDKLEVYDNHGLYGHGSYSSTRSYTEGTLVIEFVDRTKKAVVWHGMGKSRVTSETSDERLLEIISAILAHYPPGQVPESGH
jgi:hypothetical protein